MWVFKVGGVHYIFTSRSIGMMVQPARSEIRCGGKPPKDDDEAIKAVAETSARGSDWHPCRVVIGPAELLGYFGDSAPVVGEVVKASTFSR